MTRAATLILDALAQVSEPYRLGAEGPVLEDLKVWDCSELVQHMLARAGVTEVINSDGVVTPINQFDGAGFQWERSRSIPLQAGISTPAALLFIRSEYLYPAKLHFIGHVAMSLGDGYIIEARGKAYGVVISPVRESFCLATKVDQLYMEA